MTRSVRKICRCRKSAQLKCRHPWWFDFKRPGLPRVRKSLDVVLERHIDSKTIAEDEAARLRTGIVAQTLPARTCLLLGLPASAAPAQLERLTVAELLTQYRERHLEHTATKANAAYRVGAIVRTVIPRLDGTPAALGDWLASDLTLAALSRFRDVRRVRHVDPLVRGRYLTGGPVAANRDLKLLSAAFTWAIEQGIVEQSPFRKGWKKIVGTTAELKRSRRLQDGEAERLLPQCGPRLRVFVEAALETGCREGEIVELQWRGVDLARRTIALEATATKTHEARTIPISARLHALLEMRRLDPAGRVLPPAAYVFGDEIGRRVEFPRDAWELARNRAGLGDFHFHDLRREAGSRWMDAGVPLATIQRWLGHTNVAQTSTYLSTTAAGEHEAMRRFDERRGRLTPIDTGGVTPPHDVTSSDSTANRNAQQNTVRH